MADLLGRDLEFGRVPEERFVRDFVLRADSVRDRLPAESSPSVTQLAIIIILYLFDAECKTTLKNIVPNIKSVFNPQPEKIEGADD